LKDIAELKIQREHDREEKTHSFIKRTSQTSFGKSLRPEVPESPVKSKRLSVGKFDNPSATNKDSNDTTQNVFGLGIEKSKGPPVVGKSPAVLAQFEKAAKAAPPKTEVRVRPASPAQPNRLSLIEKGNSLEPKSTKDSAQSGSPAKLAKPVTIIEPAKFYRPITSTEPSPRRNINPHKENLHSKDIIQNTDKVVDPVKFIKSETLVVSGSKQSSASNQENKSNLNAKNDRPVSMITPTTIETGGSVSSDKKKHYHHKIDLSDDLMVVPVAQYSNGNLSHISSGSSDSDSEPVDWTTPDKVVDENNDSDESSIFQSNTVPKQSLIQTIKSNIGTHSDMIQVKKSEFEDVKDRLKKEVDSRNVQEVKMNQMKERLETFEKLAKNESNSSKGLRVTTEEVKSTTKPKPSIESSSNTPTSIYGEYETYKTKTNKKIAELEYLVKEEKTKTSRFEVLKLENEELKEKSSNQDTRIQKMKERMSQLHTQLYETGKLSHPFNSDEMLNEIKFTPKVIPAGDPGFVRSAQTVFEPNSKKTHTKRNSGSVQMTDSTDDGGLSSLSVLLFEISSLEAKADSKEFREIEEQVNMLQTTDSKINQVKESMLRIVTQLGNQNLMTKEIKVLKEKLAASDSLLTKQWEGFQVETKTLNEEFNQLRKKNAAMNEEFEQKSTDLINQVKILTEKCNIYQTSTEPQDIINKLKTEIEGLKKKGFNEQTLSNASLLQKENIIKNNETKIISLYQDIKEFEILKTSQKSELAINKIKLDQLKAAHEIEVKSHKELNERLEKLQ
jgi:hypothetical protein